MPFETKMGITIVGLLASSAVIQKCRTSKATLENQMYCLAPEINAPDALANAREVFSAYNIIHQVFSIEAEIFCPQDVVRAYQILGQFLLEVKAKVAEEGISKEDAEGNLRIVQRLMEKTFELKEQEDASFMSNLIGKGLDCDTSSLVMLALAQELGWPVNLIYEVGYDVNHVIARWGEGINSTSWDTRYQGPVVEWSYRPYHFRAQRDLDRNGILSIIYANRAFTKSDRGDFQGAIKDNEKALELFPQNDGAKRHLEYCRKQLDALSKL